MTDPTVITEPLIIMHRLPSGKVECHLHSPPGEQWQHGHFAILIADIVRHAAKATGADDVDIMRIVHTELDNPTSEVTGGRPS